VRSHHEMIRVSDRRVCYPQFRQDNQPSRKARKLPGFTPTSNKHAPGKYHPRNVPISQQQLRSPTIAMCPNVSLPPTASPEHVHNHETAPLTHCDATNGVLWFLTSYVVPASLQKAPTVQHHLQPTEAQSRLCVHATLLARSPIRRLKSSPCHAPCPPPLPCPRRHGSRARAAARPQARGGRWPRTEAGWRQRPTARAQRWRHLPRCHGR